MDGVFDSTWRARCAVSEVSQTVLNPLIGQHYLQKPPAVSRCCLLMTCDIWNVGMVVFADAPLQTSVRYGGVTWELARLWIDDNMPRNAESWLIGKALRHVNRTYADVQFIVSYADPSAGHVGTIYKASNWEFDGMTQDGRNTPRCDLVSKDGKKYSRAAHVPEGEIVMRVPRVSKTRFVYRLQRTRKQATANEAVR